MKRTKQAMKGTKTLPPEPKVPWGQEERGGNYTDYAGFNLNTRQFKTVFAIPDVRYHLFS